MSLILYTVRCGKAGKGGIMKNNFKLFIRAQLAGRGKNAAAMAREGFNTTPQNMSRLLNRGYKKMSVWQLSKIAEYLGFLSEVTMLENFKDWQQKQQERL